MMTKKSIERELRSLLRNFEYSAKRDAFRNSEWPKEERESSMEQLAEARNDILDFVLSVCGK